MNSRATDKDHTAVLLFDMILTEAFFSERTGCGIPHRSRLFSNKNYLFLFFISRLKNEIS